MEAGYSKGAAAFGQLSVGSGSRGRRLTSKMQSDRGCALDQEETTGVRCSGETPSAAEVNMLYMQKGLTEQVLTGPLGGDQRIGIVCPQPYVPQGVVWACFSKEACAGDRWRVAHLARIGTAKKVA